MSGKVKSYFDTLADGWEGRYQQRSDYRERARVFDAAIETVLGETEVRSVLEIGCGAKSMFSAVRHPGVDYYATDFSYEMLKRNRGGGALFQADVLRLPVARSFDLVILSSVIEWLDQPELVPAIAAGIVATGGCLMVSYPNEKSLPRLVETHLLKNLKRLAGSQHYTAMQARVKYATLENLFASEGFGLVKVHYFGKNLVASGRYSSSLRLDIYKKEQV